MQRFTLESLSLITMVNHPSMYLTCHCLFWKVLGLGSDGQPSGEHWGISAKVCCRHASPMVDFYLEKVFYLHFVWFIFLSFPIQFFKCLISYYKDLENEISVNFVHLKEHLTFLQSLICVLLFWFFFVGGLHQGKPAVAFGSGGYTMICIKIKC